VKEGERTYREEKRPTDQRVSVKAKKGWEEWRGVFFAGGVCIKDQERKASNASKKMA